MSNTATHLAALLAALNAASRHTRGMPTDGVSFDPEDPTLPARRALANLRRHLAGVEVELGALRRRVAPAALTEMEAHSDPMGQDHDEVEVAIAAALPGDLLAAVLPHAESIRRLAAQRDAARRALQAAMRTPVWVDAAVALPEMATGPGHTSGWSRWVMCTDAARLNDDGPIIFTAAYSHVLGKWEALGASGFNAYATVTHWQDLPTAPPQRPVAGDAPPA